MIHKLANRFIYLDSLIHKRATGSPKELAARLGITERAWYKLRDKLVNDLNLPLAYDSYRRTYYYTEEGRLVFKFLRKLDTDSMEKLEGGRALSATTTAYWSSQQSCHLFSENIFTTELKVQ